jgi:hypothetical protein
MVTWTDRYGPSKYILFNSYPNDEYTTLETLESQWYSTLPSLMPGPNAGMQPQLTINGIDRNFVINLMTGMGPKPGSLFTVTFPDNWLLANNLQPFIAFPANQNAASIMSSLAIYLTMNSTGFVVNSGMGGLKPKTSYLLNFLAHPN